MNVKWKRGMNVNRETCEEMDSMNRWTDRTETDVCRWTDRTDRQMEQINRWNR